MEQPTVEKKQDPVLCILLFLLRAALILGLLFYLLYHLTNGFSAEMRTQIVKPVTEEIFLESEGTVVRDERLVTAEAYGVVSYRFADGDRVKVGAKLAMLYGGMTDSASVARIAQIDHAIDLLSAVDIREDTNLSDGAAADRTVAEKLLALSERISRGRYAHSSADADELLAALVRRETILGDGGAAVGSRLAALRAERETLAATLGTSETVYAPEAGYFYSYADGGEGVFDFERVQSLTPAEYRLKLSAIAKPDASVVGKIVRSPKWYLLMPVPKAEAYALKNGNTYSLLFGADGIRMDMRLLAKNESGEETLLVFTTNAMPAEFSFARTQKVSVVTDTVEGYRIPASALRVVDGTVGVYVRSGNTVHFRAAEVLYESGTHVFVSANTEGVTLYTDDTDETNDLYCKGLSLYDAVIVSGAKDLTPEGIVK